MTKDADFKRHVRARMEKTGETYAAARDALLRPGATPAESPRSSENFAPNARDPRVIETHSKAAQLVADLDDLSITVEDNTLHVMLGKHGVFETHVPIAAIRSATRVPERAAGRNIGAHGFRGKWLVNSTATGLVRLTLEPRVRADVRTSVALEAAGVPDRVPRLLRPLTRDRAPMLRELTLSVDNPDAFLAAIRR